MNATRLRTTLLLTVFTGLSLIAGLACGGKKLPGETSPVILARQRAFGFTFEIKSPGGALSEAELRQFADTIKDGIQRLYQPRDLQEFQVKPRSGGVHVVDVAFEAVKNNYDDVFMLAGKVTKEGFSGRIRLVNAAGGGAVVDEAVEAQLSAVKIQGPEADAMRPAASVGEATAQTIKELLIGKYKNPNDYEALGVRSGQAMEGVESLANNLVQQAGCAGVGCFRQLHRNQMDDTYILLNYAVKLLERIREAYVKNEISMLSVKDTERIQRLTQKVQQLSEVTGYYEEEVAISAADFKVDFEFQNVNETFQQYFRDAFAKSGLEAAIREYTAKPATILAVYDVASDAGTLYLKVRYSNRRYRDWLKRKKLQIEDTRVLPFTYFNKLMAEFYKFRVGLLKVGTSFDRKTLSKFGLVLELQRKLYGWTQMRVSVFEGKLRPISSLRMKLCDYPPTDVPTAKPNFTGRTGLYVLGTPQNVAGQRLPYASVYEFFTLDDLYHVTYPRACQVGEGTDIYVDTGSKGAKQRITIP